MAQTYKLLNISLVQIRLLCCRVSEMVLFQVEEIHELERQLNYLKKESQNIAEISASLPEFCPKSNELCLEDQC